MASSSRAAAACSLAKKTLELFVGNGRSFSRFFDKVTVTSETDGHCVCEMKVEPRHCDRNGNLHNGMTTSLMELVGGMANVTKTGRDFGLSVNINISFLKRINVGEEIVIDGKTIKVCESLAFTEVKITNKRDGELVATGKETKFTGEGVPTLHFENETILKSISKVSQTVN